MAGIGFHYRLVGRPRSKYNLNFCLRPRAPLFIRRALHFMKPFRISTLVFLKDAAGRLLLLRRKKSPNLHKWSPIGGKLDFDTGESPYECAMRETFEETAHAVTEEDLRLFAYVSEKSYEGSGHWLMFLFDCLVPIPSLPPEGDEGAFAFFDRSEIDSLPIPPSDHLLVWPLYDNRKEGFRALRADCSGDGPPKIKVEAEPVSRQDGRSFSARPDPD